MNDEFLQMKHERKEIIIIGRRQSSHPFLLCLSLSALEKVNSKLIKQTAVNCWSNNKNNSGAIIGWGELSIKCSCSNIIVDGVTIAFIVPVKSHATCHDGWKLEPLLIYITEEINFAEYYKVLLYPQQQYSSMIVPLPAILLASSLLLSLPSDVLLV